MENLNFKNAIKKQKRSLRVRSNIHGTKTKPRLCVVKTNKHIQVQLIDDESGVTVASIATNSKELQGTPYVKKNKESAKALGERISQKALTLGIQQVVFDRGPFKFHGILAELAKVCRDKGLQF